MTDEQNAGRRLCLLDEEEYPVGLKAGNVEVWAAEPEGLAEAFAEFTTEFFTEAGRPGVYLNPLAFSRGFDGSKRRGICPASWPIPGYLTLVIEQITSDTAGMQPRYWYNDLPWILQPNIYVECYQVVIAAKRAADDWEKDQPKDSTPDAFRSDALRRRRQPNRPRP